MRFCAALAAGALSLSTALFPRATRWELMLVFLRVLASLLRVWFCACFRDHVPGAVCLWWVVLRLRGQRGQGQVNSLPGSLAVSEGGVVEGKTGVLAALSGQSWGSGVAPCVDRALRRREGLPLSWLLLVPSVCRCYLQRRPGSCRPCQGASAWV